MTVESVPPKAATDEQWMVAAYRAIVWCAVHHRRFTTQEVWERLDMRGVPTAEGRQLGPVMKRAAQRGLIEHTGQWVNSRIPRQHGRPVPVWKSLIEPQ